jgi:hypothetical protein
MIPFIRKGTQQGSATIERSPDDITSRFVARVSRRRACQTLSGGALGAVLAGLGLSDVAASCRRTGKRCRRNGQCCSGRCKRNKCRRERVAVDPPGGGGGDAGGGGGAGTGEAEFRQRVLVSGTIDITDDETFGSDERCAHSVSVDSGPLTSADPLFATTIARGCGGEVRVEVALQAALRDNGDIGVSGRVYLFEGTSEATTDLDGEEVITAFIVPRDSSALKEVTVRNVREGGDYANIRLTFHNASA